MPHLPLTPGLRPRGSSRLADPPGSDGGAAAPPRVLAPRIAPFVLVMLLGLFAPFVDGVRADEAGGAGTSTKSATMLGGDGTYLR